ncbi:hypothetical protein [Planococcus beigongshangi]|uniref:hypothetical protein n=1 Tax=Planococcus beigongshangi TaxID=2782536 RepID=UPI00193B6701|nr:hypothetical protein [Planococcus beigongshangi]
MYDFIDQKKIIYITFAVILFVSAFFAPFAIFYPIKAMFITPDSIAIGTSSTSLLTGGIGLALVASGLIVLANVEHRLKKYLSALPLFVIGLIGVSLSLTDYYYVTPDNFVRNAPFAYTSETYEWADFEKVEERIVKENGITRVDSYTFIMKDGEVITMSSGSLDQMRGTIINSVQFFGGTHERIELE